MDLNDDDDERVFEVEMLPSPAPEGYILIPSGESIIAIRPSRMDEILEEQKAKALSFEAEGSVLALVTVGRKYRWEDITSEALDSPSGDNVRKFTPKG